MFCILVSLCPHCSFLTFLSDATNMTDRQGRKWRIQLGPDILSTLTGWDNILFLIMALFIFGWDHSELFLSFLTRSFNMELLSGSHVEQKQGTTAPLHSRMPPTKSRTLPNLTRWTITYTTCILKWITIGRCVARHCSDWCWWGEPMSKWPLVSRTG